MKPVIVSMRPLGEGGNGVLFIGRRSDTNEFVVVKYLRDSQLPHLRRAFAREVRILTQGRRGMVPVLFADISGPQPFYVMPFLPGGSLAAHVGRLTPPQLLTVSTEIATALAQLHSEWIAHGDVKPDNVLLASDGHLIVADPLGNGLGCTMLFSENHGGTPGYWAPEVAAGGSISNSGDVYSYGATLYHLLTGIRPRDGEKLEINERQREAAPWVVELIEACCQFAPQSRPTMPEVLRMLQGERWVGIVARRKRNRELASAGVVAGIVLLVTALRS
jgi:eukaryotic-like serine/threonine-protein kinase